MFKYLNKGIPTPIAISIIILMAVIVGGGILAYQYWWLPKEEARYVACTMEAKVCPDGSTVSRTGPNCEFAECPIGIACTSEDGKLEEGRLCCSGYTEKINVDGSRICTSIKNLPEYNCQIDSDCGVNICDCKAMNDKYIKPADKLCMRVCNGVPKCVEGVCRLLEQ